MNVLGGYLITDQLPHEFCWRGNFISWVFGVQKPNRGELDPKKLCFSLWRLGHGLGDLCSFYPPLLWGCFTPQKFSIHHQIPKIARCKEPPFPNHHFGYSCQFSGVYFGWGGIWFSNAAFSWKKTYLRYEFYHAGKDGITRKMVSYIDALINI